MTADLNLIGAFVDGSEDPGLSLTRIFGVRLRKFCLWHSLLLQTIDSPFIRGGPATLFDLRNAVAICSLRYGDSRIRRPRLIPGMLFLRATLAAMASKLPFWPKAAPDAPSAMQRALQPSVNHFLAYTGDYRQEVDFSIRPASGGGKPRTARGRFPETFEHVFDLISWGIPERRAWEMPIGMANISRVAALRDKGCDVDIVTEADRKLQESLPPEYKGR